MLARDVNSNPTQYRVWIVPDFPDYKAELYTGYKSGDNPFVDVSAYLINDDDVIADFNLPLPANWKPFEFPWDFPIRKVLPDPVEDSQLAIINGYAYMFGGKVSDKIYRAKLDNPADWEDTGSRLPTALFASQLAIVNDTIYLFGGNTGDGYGEGAVDTIYSAPMSNPLQWTNHGSLLPRKLHLSSLGMQDGYLYLFGGREINNASDVIFSASTSDPLTWIDTGARLPYPVYNAVIAQLNNNWYLYGGLQALNIELNTIIKASVTDPLTWSVSGTLPYAISAGQFISAGDDGYIIGPVSSNIPAGFTSILGCKLLNPTIFLDVVKTVPGVISHSQVAIIYDRVWLFGGSGESAVFACNQEVKYRFDYIPAVAYANKTRILFPATDNINNPFQALGFPYWKTDYRM